MKLLEIAELAITLLLKEHPGARPVLIVEDDQTLGLMISIYLEKMGIKSERHTNLKDAKQALKERKFGMIILDINFPVGGNGFEFWEELQTNVELSEIPVVFVSGMTIWVSTIKGPKKFREADPKQLFPGQFWMFIPKGSSGFQLAVQRAAKLLGMTQIEARKLMAFRLASAGAFIVLGMGLHAGWWVNLFVELKRLIKLI